MSIYEYEISNNGVTKKITVYRYNVKIYEKGDSAILSDNMFKSNAILSLSGEYPGVENMTVKTSYVSTVDPITSAQSQTNQTKTTSESLISPITETYETRLITSGNVQPINTITPPSTITSVSKQTIETKGIKYQILQTIITPTIELDELSISAPISKSKTQRVEDVISIEVPLIKINDYVFNRDEIVSMTIDCTEFLPKITLTVNFLSQMFLTKEMAKDGDIISVAVRNKSKLLKIIRNDYVITGVHVVPNLTEVKSPVIMTFYGELFIPGLKSQTNDFSFEGSSFEALQDFSKRYRLGFSTNEQNTNDKQIWLKANMSGDIYVNNIVDRAWKDETSFYECWIDIYYNLNFVNMNYQLMSIETEVDIATVSSNLDKNWNFGSNSNSDTDTDKTMPMAKVFSNYPNYRTTSFYIYSWYPINKSSRITFQIGTKMVCELFEHNKNVYANSKAQKYWAVPKEPSYDKGKWDRMILLRGRAKFDASTNTTDLKRANYSYVDLYQKFPWLGIQYTISNPDDDNLKWDGNHHKNYQVAKVQNLINNKELDKLNVHVQVDGYNFNIIKGDKIPIVLLKLDAIENMKINPDAKFNDMLDLFYSGWYLVKGYTLNWQSRHRESVISAFTQEFVLTRREWPAPLPVKPIQTKQTTETKI
jgi:hypothetical protein